MRRREAAEFAEEDKKVKERARPRNLRRRIRSSQFSEDAECGGRGQEEKILMHEMRSSMREMRDG